MNETAILLFVIIVNTFFSFAQSDAEKFAKRVTNQLPMLQ